MNSSLRILEFSLEIFFFTRGIPESFFLVFSQVGSFSQDFITMAFRICNQGSFGDSVFLPTFLKVVLGISTGVPLGVSSRGSYLCTSIVSCWIPYKNSSNISFMSGFMVWIFNSFTRDFGNISAEVLPNSFQGFLFNFYRYTL